MSLDDPDETGSAESIDKEELTAGELTETETCEQAMRQLLAALAATEPADKQFHIRQALQLLTIDER